MKSIKQLILMTALLGITGSISQVYAMERDELIEEAEEERKESMEQREARIAFATEDLFSAVKKDNIEAAEKALREGVNPNTKTRSALYFVKSPAMARLLIAYGSKVNMKNLPGDTPLHSIYNKILRNPDNNQDYWEIMDILLAAGANPNTNNAKYDVNTKYDMPIIVELVMDVTTGDADIEIVKQLISKLITAGARPFDMNRIRNENLKTFIEGEFAKQEQWMRDWPKGQGPALVRESLPQDLQQGVPDIMDEYLTDEDTQRRIMRSRAVRENLPENLRHDIAPLINEYADEEQEEAAAAQK